LNIQQLHQLVINPSDAGDVNLVAQKFVWRADIAPVGVDNTFNLTYQKAHFLALYVGNDNETTGELISGSRAFADRGGEVDYRHGLPAHIERVHKPRVLIHHWSYCLKGNQLLNLERGQTKHLLVMPTEQQQPLGMISFRGCQETLLPGN